MFFIKILFLLVCLVSISTAGLALEEKGTPNNDSIYVTTSIDGTHFTKPQGPLFKKASSPEIILLKKSVGKFPAGTVLLYYVNFENWGPQSRQAEFISLATTTDGKKWSSKQKVNFIANKPFHATDPSLIQLENGQLRMYFMMPSHVRGKVNILSAISSDGVNFKLEDGIRITSTGNPEVFTINNKWFMLISASMRGQYVRVAISNDGLVWKEAPEYGLIRGGAPGVLQRDNNTVDIFSNVQGIAQYIFDPVDVNKIVHKPTGIHLPGIIGDPSPVKLDNGSILMVFKNRSQ